MSPKVSPEKHQTQVLEVALVFIQTVGLGPTLEVPTPTLVGHTPVPTQALEHTPATQVEQEHTLAVKALPIAALKAAKVMAGRRAPGLTRTAPGGARTRWSRRGPAPL